MALQAFTWNNGTNDNPVPLNAQQLANLVKLASKENIAKDVRGHITTSSGTISRYDKYVLNQAFPNLTVHAAETSDSFSITASKSSIVEGETLEIQVLGMAVNAVDFDLEYTVRSLLDITESAVKQKIRMNGNVLEVDTPSENAGWEVSVRVKAKPAYESWENTSAIRYIDIVVSATPLSGIQLVGGDVVACGESIQITAVLTPSTTTKGSGVSLVNYLTSDGSLQVSQPIATGNTIYVTAPNEECNLTLQTNVYLFGNTNVSVATATKSLTSKFPYLQVNVTTDGTFSDISGANNGAGPKILFKKVNKQGEVINTITPTKTVTDSTLIYTARVLGNSTETYKISFEDVYKYDSINDITTIPSSVATIINVQYIYKKPKTYFANADGSRFEKLETALANGRVSIAAKYIVVYTEGEGEIDPERCICFEIAATYMRNSNYNAALWSNKLGGNQKRAANNYDYSQNYHNLYATKESAKGDYNGYQNTKDILVGIAARKQAVIDIYPDNTDVEGGINTVLSYLTTTFMGKTAEGYIHSAGEVVWFCQFIEHLTTQVNSLGISFNFKFWGVDGVSADASRTPKRVLTSTLALPATNKTYHYGGSDGNYHTELSPYTISSPGSDWTDVNSNNYVSILPFIHIDMDEFKARNEIGRPRLKVEITTNETDTIKLDTIMSRAITVTKPDGTTVDLLNGQGIDVLGDGTETYSISAPTIDGYVLSYEAEVVPNSFLTRVTITYTKLDNGIYLVYSDGTYQSYEDYASNYQPIAGKTIKAIGVIGDGVSMLIDPTFNTKTKFKTDGAIAEQNFPKISKRLITAADDGVEASAQADFDGYGNTQAFLLDMKNPNNSSISSSLLDTMNAREPFTIGGVDKEWYVPSLGEAIVIYNNETTIKQLLTIFNVSSLYYFDRGTGAGRVYGTSTFNKFYNSDIFVYAYRPTDSRKNAGYSIYTDVIVVYKP